MMNTQTDPYVPVVRAAIEADPGISLLKSCELVDDRTVHFSARVPNRYGSEFGNAELRLSAKWIANVMRESGLPLFAVLVGAAAQDVAVRQIRNDIGCRNAETDRLRDKMLQGAIENGKRRLAEAEAKAAAKTEALEREIGSLKARLAAQTADLRRMSERVAAFEAADRKRRDEEKAKAAAVAREKALTGKYQFPEAGDGRWSLREIILAFKVARTKVGNQGPAAAVRPDNSAEQAPCAGVARLRAEDQHGEGRKCIPNVLRGGAGEGRR